MSRTIIIGTDTLTDHQIEALEAFWEASQGKDERGKTLCLFCKGGYRCRCGGCPEFEYHKDDCFAMLVYNLLHMDELTLHLTMDWEDSKDVSDAGGREATPTEEGYNW